MADVIKTLKVISFYVKGTTDVETEESKNASKESLEPLNKFMAAVKKMNDQEYINTLTKYSTNDGLLLIDPTEDESSMLTLFLTSIELQMKFLIVRKRNSFTEQSLQPIYNWFTRLFVKYASFFRDSPNNGHMMYFLAKLVHNEMKLGQSESSRKISYNEGIEQANEQVKYVAAAQRRLDDAKRRGETGSKLYDENSGLKKSQDCLKDQQTEASQQMIEPGSVQRFVVKQITEKIETNLINGIVESEKTRQTKILAYNVYYYNIMMSSLLFIHSKPDLNKIFDWKGTKDNIEKVVQRLIDPNVCDFFAKKYDVPGMKPGSINRQLFDYLYNNTSNSDVPPIGLSLLGIGSRDLKGFF